MTQTGIRRFTPIVLVSALSLVGGGCELAYGPMSRSGAIKIVMNPDSTQFAYAVDYHRYPGWLIPFPPPGARVEIWTYDLSRREGPRRSFVPVELRPVTNSG